jgi:hypothetical protein
MCRLECEKVNQKWLPEKFEFDADSGRTLRQRFGALRRFKILDGVHGFRLHPLHTPDTRREWSLLARNVVDATVKMVDTLVRSAAADIPIEKDATPVMMMHRFLHPRRNKHFEYTHEGIIKKDFVAFGSCLDRVEALRKTRLALRRQPQRGSDKGRHSCE